MEAKELPSKPSSRKPVLNKLLFFHNEWQSVSELSWGGKFENCNYLCPESFFTGKYREDPFGFKRGFPRILPIFPYSPHARFFLPGGAPFFVRSIG
ncbi:MAG: hypothetical protein IKM05_08185 [Clostridia bacterium]|nr:hypothetical protein [Clostridia bacterium]